MFSFEVRPGVRLRLLETRQAAELFALTDRNRERLRRWLPWLDAIRTQLDSDDFIRKTLAQFANGYGFQTGVWVGSDLAGVVGFHPYDWSNHSCSLGYWMGGEFEGRGIMTDCVRMLVGYAFEVEGMNRVEIRAAVGNQRSRAIPERLGFQQEGVLRQVEWLYDHYEDHVVYGVLASDWLRAQQ